MSDSILSLMAAVGDFFSLVFWSIGLTLPFWGSTALLTYIVESIGQSVVVRNLASSHIAQELTRKVVLEAGTTKFDEHRIPGWPTHDQLDSLNSRLRTVHIASAALGIAVGWVVMFAAYDSFAFRVLTLYPPLRNATKIAGYILSAGVPILMAFLHIARRSVEDILQQQVQATARRVQEGLLEIEDRLKPLKTDMRILGTKVGLDLNFPPQLASDICEYFKNASLESVPEKTSAELDFLIGTVLAHIREYRNVLREVDNVYADAKGLWQEISLQVIRTRSQNLASRIETDYVGLVSQIEEIISDEERNKLHPRLDTIARGLTDLRESAMKYLREDVHGDMLHHDAETDKATACRILGVPVNASISQIKRVYRALVAVWHPDAGLVTDEGRIKEINWAHNLLLEKRA
jgi:heat shock protein HspQ